MDTNLKSRVQSAVTILKSYLTSIDNPEDFLEQVLFEMGIDDSEIGIEVLEAESTSFDDFKSSISKHCGFSKPEPCIPEPRLKLAWSTLTKKSATKVQETVAESGNLFSTTLIQTLRPIGQWADLELLEKYGKETPIDIEEELKKRSKNRPCIIFFDNGEVDAENSLYMIRKARYQETPSTFVIRGEMKQVYRVGEFPLDVLFECPLHKHILLVDGYCEECGSTFDTKEMDRLIFIRLVTENLPKTDPLLYKDLTLEKLIKQFPKIYIHFKTLKDEDKLPSLKRRVSKGRDNDPFRITSHKTF